MEVGCGDREPDGAGQWGQGGPDRRRGRGWQGIGGPDGSCWRVVIAAGGWQREEFKKGQPGSDQGVKGS